MIEERWLPLAEAARILGISVDAARRKVKGGALIAEKRETPQGGTWWVYLAPHGELPPAASRLAPPSANSSAAQELDLSSLVGLVERLQAQLLERTEAATLWQARAFLLEDRVRALQAPAAQEAQQGPYEGRSAAQGPETSSGRHPHRPRQRRCRVQRPSRHRHRPRRQTRRGPTARAGGDASRRG